MSSGLGQCLPLAECNTRSLSAITMPNPSCAGSIFTNDGCTLTILISRPGSVPTRLIASRSGFPNSVGIRSAPPSAFWWCGPVLGGPVLGCVMDFCICAFLDRSCASSVSFCAISALACANSWCRCWLAVSPATGPVKMHAQNDMSNVSQWCHVKSICLTTDMIWHLVPHHISENASTE